MAEAMMIKSLRRTPASKMSDSFQPLSILVWISIKKTGPNEKLKPNPMMNPFQIALPITLYFHE
jgi:hypothetical protein